MTSEFTVAVHGLVYLNHHEGQVYSSEALAENVCTNPARIRKIMAKLKRAGFVETREGKQGGYTAVDGCGGISLCQVAEALGESFVSASWKSGNADMECLIASGMGAAMEKVFEELDRLCRERLTKITIADVDREVTGHGRENQADDCGR